MSTDIINQAIASYGIIGIIIFFLALFLFLLPIIFMLGTLTRLTDIKYKMDIIIDFLSSNLDRSNGNPEPELELEENDKLAEKTSSTITMPNFVNEAKKEIVGLKHPSKVLIFILIGIIGLFLAVMCAIYFGIFNNH